MFGMDSHLSGQGHPGQPAGNLDNPLLDVQQVAELLRCSERHLYRLIDRGAVPPPIRLGALVRWSRATIYQWISNGCPSCRQGGRH